MKKKPNNNNGYVYSTDPDFKMDDEPQVVETLPSGRQKLRITLDTKQRAGKVVTLISGFVGNDNDLQELGKKLKNFCGTGGSAKEGEIIIQGDQREKVKQYLVKNGFGLKG